MENNLNKTPKRLEKEAIRNKKIIDTAFQIFVEKKIEPVSMGEIADAVGIGRATLFRCYSSKLELVIAVCSAKWKEYFDALDEVRPISSVGDIPAIGRFIFTLDSYIDMYQNHKDLLQFNDNFNHYVTHEKAKAEMFEEFHRSLYSANTRFHLMFEKGEGGQYLPHGHPGGDFLPSDAAFHDGNLCALRGRFYLGSRGQQGLHGRTGSAEGNDHKFCKGLERTRYYESKWSS